MAQDKQVLRQRRRMAFVTTTVMSFTMLFDRGLNYRFWPLGGKSHFFHAVKPALPGHVIERHDFPGACDRIAREPRLEVVVARLALIGVHQLGLKIDGDRWRAINGNRTTARVGRN